jgi:hypothetical protein
MANHRPLADLAKNPPVISAAITFSSIVGSKGLQCAESRAYGELELQGTVFEDVIRLVSVVFFKSCMCVCQMLQTHTHFAANTRARCYSDSGCLL